MSELKNKAIKGAAWSTIEQVAVQGLQFAFGLAIARIVTPSEYGLIAMLTIFIAIAQTFVDSGFSNALIQKQSDSQKDYSTVFIFNVVTAVILYLILFFTAPFIAQFYHSPELTNILRIVSLTLIINSLGSIQRTLYVIKLNFKPIALIALGGALISGVTGIVMANLGYGVWALVGMNIVGTIWTTVCYWVFSRWLPDLIFSSASLKNLFSFGSKILVSGLIRTIYLNLYSLVIGRKYNSTDVGYFNRSSSLAQYFTGYIVMIIERVLYPMQCSIQDDEKKLTDSFAQMIRITSFVVFPIASLLIILAYPLIEVVLTVKWLPSAPFLQILCAGYLLSPILMINTTILNVKGRSDLFLKSEIIKKSIAVIVLIITIPLGLTWLCWGIFVYNVFDAGISIFYAKRVVGTGFTKQMFDLAKIAMTCLVMSGAVFSTILLFDTALMKLLVGSMVGIVVFFGFAYLLRIKELFLIKEVVRVVFKKHQSV